MVTLTTDKCRAVHKLQCSEPVFFFQDKVLRKCEYPRVMRSFVIYRYDADGDAPLSICELELIGEKGKQFFFYSYNSLA